MFSTAIPRGIQIGLALSITLVLGATTGILALKFGLLGQGDRLPVLAEMPEFHLIDQSGRGAAAADFAGKVLVVGFIYTSCPDICPMVTAEMRTLQEHLSRAGLLGRLELISISVDPVYDTPDRLHEYAQRFGAQTDTWHFLTGDPDHVRDVVVNGFMMGMVPYDLLGSVAGGDDQTGHEGQSGHDHQGSLTDQAGRSDQVGPGDHGSHTDQASQRSHGADYLVEHSGLIALIDGQGRVRAYHDGHSLDQNHVMAQVRQLLKGR